MSDFTMEGVEQLPLKIFTENAYLEYAMYVILDRALPHIGDGLKPVQRRIVYAMSELGLKATAKHKKSARTVGDVLGKYHPHGDSACYEAMVLMAQPFSYRYPLVDGQGNWGSSDDPKSFAAMRYTEARLSNYTHVLLSELGLGAVKWIPNFDGTLEEPEVLPARLPNLLLNGSTGIAVGMATDIPSHNLREVVEALVYLLDHPDAGLMELCKFIKGPDYPTEAEIISSPSSIASMYETGGGMIKMRAVYTMENGDVVITALPHQVSGARVLEQIAAQMQSKKLPMVEDLRDESDHESPTRLVIVPRSSRVDKEALMAHLFATTDLEKNYRVNMNLIGLNGKPQVKNLKTILTEWLHFRRDQVTERTAFRLKKLNERLHILDGLLTAFLNIDEVIAIIRNEDHPKQVLMKRFGLTDVQAEAILELKLRHLAKLEEMKIRGEQDELAKERSALEKILSSPKEMNRLIKKELKEDAKSYGDDRRSPVVERTEAQAMVPSDLVPVEPVTVILSKSGWIRAAKSHDYDESKIRFKAGDELLSVVHGRSDQQVVFLDSTGRTYSIVAHGLPSARGQGEPLTGRLSLPPEASVTDAVMGEPEDLVIMASDAGYGFISSISDLYTRNKNGKAVLSLPENALPLRFLKYDRNEESLIAAITNSGKMLIFPVKDLPALSKGKGNKIINISTKKAKDREELLTDLFLIPEGAQLVIYSGKRHFTLKEGNLTGFMGSRGLRGKKLPRGYQKVDRYEIIVKQTTEG